MDSGRLIPLVLVAACGVAPAEDRPCLDCDRQMRKVSEALQAWRRSNSGAYPPTLGALGSKHLLPKGGEFCPHALRERHQARASHSSQTSKGEGGDRVGAYEYELSKTRHKSINPQFVEGEVTITRFESKAPLLRRPHYEQVPLLRCSSHRAEAPNRIVPGEEARRNLGIEGLVYWSGEYWEKEWLEIVPEIARSEAVVFGLQGPPFHSNKPIPIPEALDIRPWTCARGDHHWWWSLPIFDLFHFKQPTPTLKALFQEEQGRVFSVDDRRYWLDGLVQLQGRIKKDDQFSLVKFPTRQTFVWERRNLPVGRKFGSASWLQGTIWRIADDERTAAWLEWTYEDGTTERASIIVGETTGRFWAHDKHLESQKNYPAPAWSFIDKGLINKMDRHIRVFEQTWQNPHPDLEVTHLSFIGNRECTAAPFIVAVSLHP